MYDMQYNRHRAERKIKRGLQTITSKYSLEESRNFTRLPIHEKGKPMWPAWSTAPPGDLRECETLAVRNELVQPAAPFSRRQANRYRLKIFSGIQDVDLRPTKKRKGDLCGSNGGPG